MGEKNVPSLSCHVTCQILEFSGSSVSAAVSVSPPDLRVGEKLARVLLAERPSLAEHACHASGVHRFGEVLIGTTLPHLVEHLAIDLLVEAYPGTQFVGTTTWLDDATDTMLVRVGQRGQTEPTPLAGEVASQTEPTPLATPLAEALHTAIALINEALAT